MDGVSVCVRARLAAQGCAATDEDGLRDGLHLERGEHGVCFEPSSMEGRARPDHMLDCVLRITAQVALHVCDVARLADAFFAPSSCLLDDAYEVSFFFFKFSVHLRGRDIIDCVKVNCLPFWFLQRQWFWPVWRCLAASAATPGLDI